MSLTPIQERRLRQVEDEIIFLEKEIEKKGIWFALRLAWITLMAGYLGGYFLDYLLERKSLSAYIHEFGWIKILTGLLFWFAIDYFFIVKENHRSLRNKKLIELKRID